MIISFKNEDINPKLREKQRIRHWIGEVCRLQGKQVGEIGYLFCTDEYLLSVNRTYLQHDTYTDIITFDYTEGDVVSGDILISVERVQENAVTFGVPYEQELHRVVIHGVLHLLGLKDKTDKEAALMRKHEEEALQLWESVQ